MLNLQAFLFLRHPLDRLLSHQTTILGRVLTILRSKIYNSLLSFYRKVLSGPKGVPAQEGAEEAATIVDQSA